MTTRRVMFVGGGTAGSVTPLLAVAEHIQRRHENVALIFVGSVNGPERMLAEAAGIDFRSIPSGKLRRYWDWKNVIDIFRIWHGYLASRRLIREWKPDVILSAGSFVAVPMAWAGHQAGCRVIIHQQDVRPGLANRLMRRSADTITVSFASSVGDFRHRHVVLTGNPVRSAILSGSAETARKLFKLDPSLPVILVLGGGTGSAFINNMVSQIAHRLVTFAEVIHLTGPLRDWPELHHRRYHRYPFLTWQIPHAMAAANVVVTRAGLGTITELAALAKPSVFIPLPGTHQEDNAALITSLRAGVVLDQSKVTQESLQKALQEIIRAPKTGEMYGHNLFELYRPDAVDHLAAIVMNPHAV